MGPTRVGPNSGRQVGEDDVTATEVPPAAHAHHVIMEFFVSQGYAPTVDALCEVLAARPEAVRRSLLALQDLHGVVLHPTGQEIWVAHPFSAAPTNFVVRSTTLDWWAPCAWCALGVAAVVDEDVEIVTTLGATSAQVRLRVSGGRLQDGDFSVHFPIPMSRAWDNVIYTCSTMLLFRSEAEIDVWSARHGIEKGDVQPLEKVWALARAWYGNHGAEDWRKWSAAEARQIFGGLGLTGPIWEVPAVEERF